MSLRHLRRFGSILIGIVALGTTAAIPVVADTSISESGKRGTHRLLDTSEVPGAACEYAARTREPFYYEGLLTHIDVRPPRMRAFEGTQQVAWRFSVWRRQAGQTVGRLTYRSPLQTSSATTTRSAAFAWMGTDVTVPDDGRRGDEFYFYAVRVHMIWYDAGGSPSGKSVHGVDTYRLDYNGYPDDSDSDVQQRGCPAYEAHQI